MDDDRDIDLQTHAAQILNPFQNYMHLYKLTFIRWFCYLRDRQFEKPIMEMRAFHML
jgi:hypothetical protein